MTNPHDDTVFTLWAQEFLADAKKQAIANLNGRSMLANQLKAFFKVNPAPLDVDEEGVVFDRDDAVVDLLEIIDLLNSLALVPNPEVFGSNPQEETNP